MGDEQLLNPGALEPLFGPSDIPTHHRVRAKVKGEPAEVVKGRRPSPITIAQNLRRELADWREAQYGGASDTSIELLCHWFLRDHEVRAPDGGTRPFAYYFCQREAIETLVYLHEVRGIRTLSALTADFGGADSERAALGVAPSEDLWPKYAFKLATGAGKTKVMSLAIVWSYFHSLRESDSEMARHFVVVAPGITVFERLKEDFENGRIFDADPLIPPAWRGDWNMSVVLQDEPARAATGGAIYLTNIHRLHDTGKRKSKEPDAYDWMGPKVSKASALDASEELRQRIASHRRVVVLNDEAHHVWDPDSAWNEAISFIAETSRKKGGGLVAQLDFSATPKDDKGQVFKHVVCDTPLGEAVDAGIVKSPIIGHGERLVERAHEDAAYKYENHLTLGYKRWLLSKEEWEKSGKKALLFVMTESTEAADSIAGRLNSDPIYAELNGRTINLHTNLKGKLKKKGRGKDAFVEFVESEREISDDDLKQLRKLSRELDDSTSPYRCIVSVLMLREGWDVRNVTTIIPLRPLSASSRILPEQTLGRGLRRMTPPGQAAEVVTVVEHKAFSELYRDELSQEGLPIEVVDIDQVPRTTVTIYPDAVNKDLQVLDVLIPRLSEGYRVDPDLADLTFDEVRRAFTASFQPLPLGAPTETEVKYEGRHLITDEVVEQMSIKLPLLADGVGAVSFFREELERAIRIRGQHAKLAPLIQQFLEEVLFEARVTLYDPRLVSRLADPDVREHMRATFVPLLLAKVTKKEQRLKESEPTSVCSWKPFQVTHSEKRPTQTARKTPFNLVPCANHLEVAMTGFADLAYDVAAFAKNAGPQALRIDYLNSAGRRSIYTPDFLVRLTDGSYFLVETKGRSDLDVATKAAAAIEWCKAASRQKTKWSYLFVPQDVFEQVSGNSMEALARACAPSLAETLRQAAAPGQATLPFGGLSDAERATEQLQEFIDRAVFDALPSRYRKAIEHAVALFGFHRNKDAVSFAPVFQPLLGPIDHAAEALLRARLEGFVPADSVSQADFFEPDLSAVKKNKHPFLKDQANRLKRLLVHHAPLMPTGLLSFCLGYATNDDEALPGVFTVVRAQFAAFSGSPLKGQLDTCYEFRNRYIAHQKEEKELKDVDETRDALRTWSRLLHALHSAVNDSASPPSSASHAAEGPRPPYKGGPPRA